ncbi:MAG: hypothetical protein ACM3XN_07230, partial [Chloroflexota bacterium]
MRFTILPSAPFVHGGTKADTSQTAGWFARQMKKRGFVRRLASPLISKPQEYRRAGLKERGDAL